MDRDYLIKLTLALYKVTELLPKEEPLKVVLRKESLDILALALQAIDQKTVEQIKAKINTLQVFCQIAEKQNWLDKVNFVVLNDSYGKLAEQIKEVELDNKRQEKEKPIADVKQPIVKEQAKPKNNGLKKPRHQKIVQLLEKKGACQVKDVKEVFPNISKRTLRRDMDYLLKIGIVKRRGDKNNTEYQLK